jgi:MSHA type pilus biogenesis protein MshL
MKSIQQIFQYSGLLLLLLVFSSCSSQPPQKVEETPLPTPGSASAPPPKAQSLDSKALPVEYQKPSYVVGNEQTKIDKDLARSDVIVKVGASIHSTVGPQPLRDILKRLAALKGMNISWASDVDQNALVDVDINANDDFTEAIEHLLRQINYYHEIKGNTLVVKNKETRQFHVAMPFISQTYSTETGGDVLGGSKDTNAFKGKISLAGAGSPVGTSVGSEKGDSSKRTQFDIWQNIEANLKVILDILETSETTVTSQEREFGGTGLSLNPEANSATNTPAGTTAKPAEKKAEVGKSVKTSRQTSKTGAYFTIDKPVGIITVTATRDLLERVDNYLTSLQKQMYRQVNIEAKIIEVQLNNTSSMGIDWTNVLSKATPLSLTGTVGFGDNGQLYPPSTTGSNKFISTFTLNSVNINVLLSALKEVGDTKVLSNPKLSVMNGQPSFITVGRNTTYISKVTSTQTTGSTNNTVTFTVDTSSILAGVGLALTANIMDNNEVIMNLVPVVSRLQNGVVGTEQIGSAVNGALIGLPVVDVREMSTTVKVKNGEMLVIGGLIDDTNQNTNSHIPVLGDIPILKYLFGNDSNTLTKTELIILLKPTIM